MAATLFLADFVEGLAHDAEVLLGGEGAAEALGGRAVRHVVEEALSGGADHGDDVRALACAGLRLDDILVDVARGDDDVEVRFRAFADGVQVLVALGHVALDAGEALLDVGLYRLLDLRQRMQRQRGDVQLVVGDALGDGLRGQAGLQNGVAHEVEHALAEHTGLMQRIDHPVGQRNLVLVDSVDADQTAQRALHRDGRVAVHKLLDLVCDLLRQLFCHSHLREIQSEFRFFCHRFTFLY